jgi:hypothetical protein
MQRAFGMVVDCPPDQQLLAVGGNFIGALRGAEHRHGYAYDRHGDDDANQGEQTKPRSIQARRVVSPAVCVCAEGNTVPPLDILAERQD